MGHPAVFFDRDNTIVDDPGFIKHPDQVKLMPGAAKALRRVRGCGHKIIIVSNQSGVARGLITEEQLVGVNARLHKLLADQQVSVDAVYCCPYLDGDEAVVEEYRRDSHLRKPEPGMLLKAAREHDIDLSKSWMIGDRSTDVAAGAAANCRTILVNSDRGSYNGRVQPDHVVHSILEAAGIVEQNPPEFKNPRDAAEDDTRKLLTDVRDALQHRQRREGQDDFSLVRLIGSLMQMLALVVALWGVVGIFGQREVAAIARMGLAVFLQLLAISIRLAAHHRL